MEGQRPADGEGETPGLWIRMGGVGGGLGRFRDDGLS